LPICPFSRDVASLVCRLTRPTETPATTTATIVAKAPIADGFVCVNSSTPVKTNPLTHRDTRSAGLLAVATINV
jgi:hypothetical protein